MQNGLRTITRRYIPTMERNAMPSVSFQPDDMIWKMLAHADLSSMPEADLLANVADICAFYPGRVDVSLTDGRIL